MNESRFVDMGRLRLGLVLSGLVVAAVTFIPSVASAATITDGVPGLQLCTSATHNQCDLLLAHEHFIDYANVCSFDDCFFVSAADWEKVAAGVTPTITTLDLAYKAAGQTFGGGVSAPDLWTYWKTSGIDGVYLESETAINKGEASVENAVKAKRALIVDDDSHASMIGSEKADIGLAIMLVDGYTPKGPLVVFQAKTLQMTWAQWNAQVRNVWEVAVSKTPPTVTPPPPTSTSSPTATLSLSPSSLTSAGGTVTITYSSENATTCTLTSSPSIWTTATETVSCDGTYVDTVAPSSTAQQWTFTFTASNSSGLSATSTQTLVEAAASTTPQFTTPNTIWSGYVVPSSAIVTYAEGEWTVPTINCADTPDGNVSVWIGIGGTGGTTLLQTGVASDCVDGVQQNVGWWEEYPSDPNHEANFTNFPVSDGSQFRAVISQGSNGSWGTTLSDLTTGLSGYMITGEAWGVSETGASSFTDQGSTTGLSYPGGYTAEWIVEDDTDSVTQSVYPFANFGSVTFSDLETNLTSWSLTPSETWGIVQNGVTLAAPTTSTADSFTDTYTGP